MSQVELYALLSPLERLFRRPEAAIRATVLKTLSRFAFKRSFITLRAGLADTDPTVVAQAAESLEKVHFPHAFDPLARIYRESTNARARVAAIRALAHIDTVEVAEMLLSVVEHDGPTERQAAVEALQKARGTKFVDLARSSFGRLAETAQASVRQIMQARGMAG
jgi:HEAT repeat protein